MEGRKNSWDILGVSELDSKKTIEKNYRRRSSLLHPEQETASAYTSGQYLKLSQAYFNIAGFPKENLFLEKCLYRKVSIKKDEFGNIYVVHNKPFISKPLSSIKALGSTLLSMGVFNWTFNNKDHLTDLETILWGLVGLSFFGYGLYKTHSSEGKAKLDHMLNW